MLLSCALHYGFKSTSQQYSQVFRKSSCYMYLGGRIWKYKFLSVLQKKVFVWIFFPFTWLVLSHDSANLRIRQIYFWDWKVLSDGTLCLYLHKNFCQSWFLWRSHLCCRWSDSACSSCIVMSWSVVWRKEPKASLRRCWARWVRSTRKKTRGHFIALTHLYLPLVSCL